MSKKADVFVVNHPAGWAVKSAGAQRADSVHPTQKQAIQRGVELAKSRKVELSIQGENGQIREKNTYKPKDDCPPRG